MAKKRKVEAKSEPESEEKVAAATEESPVKPEIKQEPVEESPAANASSTAIVASEPVKEANGAGGEEADGDDEDEESDEETDSENVLRLLEPFPKEQLVEILRDAALKHPDVFDRINKSADVDPAHRKIFVHGLGWDTTVESLTNAFKKYGEIEDCNAVSDKLTGKSKGYGFILFKHRSGARKALKQPQKKIGNRMTACQLASAGPVPAAPPVSEYTQRKIYVSNVSADIDPQKLLSYFSKYGEIEEGPLGLDKSTGRPKGFSLFVYRSVESAKKALEDPHKNFEGHILHCQKAVDGPKPSKAHSYHGGSSQQGFHRGDSSGGGYMHGSGSSGPVSGGGLGYNQSAGGLGYNQAASASAVAPQINPAIGQALTALLASQGAGLGVSNLLSAALNPGLGSVNQGLGNPLGGSSHGGGLGGYGNQGGVGGNLYGNQGGLSYPNMGQPSGRGQQGGSHMGGHYMR